MFIALNTRVRSFIRVTQHMLFQPSLSIKVTAALVTLEGFLSAVLHHVLFQVAGHRVRFLAQRARVRALSRVDTHVQLDLQHSTICEDVLSRRTG